MIFFGICGYASNAAMGRPQGVSVSTGKEAIIRISVLAFLAGILLVQQLPALPSLVWGILLVPLAFLAWWKPRLGLPLLFFLAGVVWITFRAGLILADRLPPELEGEDLRIDGWVAEIPVRGEHGLRFAFDVGRAWHDGTPVLLPHRIQLGVYDHPVVLQAGDFRTFMVRLKRPHGFQNPDGQDYEGYMFQQRVRAVGYVHDDQTSSFSRDPVRWVDRVNRFRQKLGANIHALLPGSAFAGMVTAFANGDGDAIPDEQWQVLNRTGTSHLVAISGMNISLVSGLIFFVLRWLWALPGITVLYVPAPVFAAFGSLLAATGYAALAGFAIPTQRALAMLLVVLAGVISGRRSAPSVLLALALLAVLLIDPLAVMAAGFWLSFAAVAVILFSVGGQRQDNWKERLFSWSRLQWAIAIGLLPLTLFLFQRASLSAPLANMLAMPLVETVVIPSTLIGVLASLLLPDALAALPFQLAARSLEWLWPVLERLAGWTDAQWVQPTPPLWTLAAATVGAALLLAPRGVPARWLGVVWLLPMLLARAPQPSPGEIWFTLLDVGQGLSAVVRTAGHTLVYDTGARFSARFDAGRGVLVPFLRHESVTHVDTLIVSHGDNDHIGGSRSLLVTLPVGRVLSSVPQRLAGGQPCLAGDSWEWDGVRFELLHPFPDSALRGNNLSCVLRVSSPYGSILLPGDIAAKAEHELLRLAAEKLPADILVVPHHGSRSSSTEAFLDRVQPRLALLPVGYRNRYRHPHPEILARYIDRGIAVEASPGAGAIGITLDPDGLQSERYRQTHRRYWYTE